ncbi:MAG: SH3 domain-containing protein [Deltaproteobacteria bacterium]|nr:SH3 domain-containing protein [Deltaproteobacteria bacterium]
MPHPRNHSLTRPMQVTCWALLVFLSLACGCTAATPESQEVYGAPEDIEITASGMKGAVPVGSTLATTAGVNFRKGASTSNSVIRVLPEGTQVVTVDQETPTNSFYKVKHQGTVGWVYGAYLQLVASPEDDDTNNDPDPPAPSGSRAAAIQRAQASVGFSYWWGHGRWRPEGPTSSTKGSCSGSCPSCSHSGSYGADCSGMVAKAWQVPSSNDSLTSDSHPYSTGDFIHSTSQWSIVSRGSLESADGLAYNNGSSGHVVLYDSGDGWGSMWVYECKGCSAGCVHDLRSLSSSYKGIRRAGY